MTDPDIRMQLKELLKSQLGSMPLPIFEEVSVSDGSARADLVTAFDGLECYEIKSAADSLKRLVRQGWHYGRAFNLITLVVASVHLEKACSIIPEWWGVIEVGSDGELSILRRATKNPNQIAHGLSELLTRSEAISLLKEQEQHRGLGKMSNKLLRQTVADLYDIETLNGRVLGFFQMRELEPELSVG